MLHQNELLSSPIVANATMNRGRGLSGVNSYERELCFNVTDFLKARVKTGGEAVWYDACCGQGRAVIEAGRQWAMTEWGRQVQITGVDLVEMFWPKEARGVSLIAADVAVYTLEKPADLITCVHGLHYLGDKLGFLQHAYTMLAPGGMLTGHLDTNNLRLAGNEASCWRLALRNARRKGAALELKNHRLCIERTDSMLDFGLSYHGATVSEQPNYTGITVIDSWYARIEAGGAR